ncbi:MAG: glycosyltransferase family 39 protein, partial [Nodosilinea sp.]
MVYSARLKGIQALHRHTGWLPYGLLVGWQGVLLVASNVHTSLMAHDEGWYTTLALGLVRSQNWLSPTWWGELIYDKTSGLHWMIAAAFSFGVSETTARLPSGVACLISVSLLYAIGSTLLNRRSAFLGALCLSTVIIWTQYGQLATQDMPLVALELAVIWALLRSEQQPQQRLAWGVAAGLGFGLGFFIKGFMVALPTVALLPYLIGSHKQHKHLANPGLYSGFLLGLGLVGCWFLALWNAHGSKPFDQLFGILALAASADYHGVGPWYYLWNIPANFLPWTPLAILGLFFLVRSPPQSRLLLTCGYPAVLMLLLQLFSTKTIYYPLQVYPFLALYSGYGLDRMLAAWQRDRTPIAAKALSCFYGSVALVALVFSVGLLTGAWLRL